MSSIETHSDNERNNQYLDFLHKIQETKMKELWDNEFDEDWENT